MDPSFRWGDRIENMSVILEAFFMLLGELWTAFINHLTEEGPWWHRLGWWLIPFVPIAVVVIGIWLWPR